MDEGWFETQSSLYDDEYSFDCTIKVGQTRLLFSFHPIKILALFGLLSLLVLHCFSSLGGKSERTRSSLRSTRQSSGHASSVATRRRLKRKLV